MIYGGRLFCECVHICKDAFGEPSEKKKTPMSGSEKKDHEMVVYERLSPSDKMNLFIDKETNRQERFFDDMTEVSQTALIEQMSLAFAQGDRRIHPMQTRYLHERQTRMWVERRHYWHNSN